jgi:leader peptidase (prepilin peptidase)/N-methyltransferase
MDSMLIIILIGLFMEIYMWATYFRKEKFYRLNYIIIVINLVAYVWFFSVYGLTPKWIQMIFLTTILSIISIIDLRYKIIPNKIIAIIFMFGVLFNIINKTVTVGNMITGFFIISIPLLIMSIVLKGSMGGGDIKLMAVAGAFLGWKSIIVAFLIGSIIASITSIILIFLRKIKRTDMIPYGPFLSMGIFIARLYGEKIISWYIGF